MKSALSLDFPHFEEEIRKLFPAAKGLEALTRTAFREIHGQARNWEEAEGIRESALGVLRENIPIPGLTLEKENRDPDGTRKFLWKLADGSMIESVLIPRETDGGKEVLTACISSQVGCAMACAFCLTGKQGLLRNLSVHEIVAQIWELRRRAPVTGIVFMGMGEPLHNLENVIQACRVFLNPIGFRFSKRRVTVSTSGLVPGIERLGREVEVSLAISLNGSTDEGRSALMPVGKKWKIEDLREACRNYPYAKRRPVTLEYVLLRDLTDRPEDAERLVGILDGIPAKLNLIPFNEHPGAPEFRRPEAARIKAFQHALVSRGVTATLRTSRGRRILAACGQLAGKGQSAAPLHPLQSPGF